MGGEDGVVRQRLAGLSAAQHVLEDGLDAPGAVTLELAACVPRIHGSAPNWPDYGTTVGGGDSRGKRGRERSYPYRFTALADRRNWTLAARRSLSAAARQVYARQVQCRLEAAEGRTGILPTKINPFVLALSDPVAYQAAYPDCSILNGDGDGDVDFDDINPFVALLSPQ